MIAHPTFTLDRELARANLTALAADQGCDDPDGICHHENGDDLT